jgi:hypothetical protein
MTGSKPYIAMVCALALLTPAGGFAADPPQGKPMTENKGLTSRITRNYRAEDRPENDLNNSPRIESLLRAGNLYLSLQDTIALALENNLDIAIQRYGPQIADTAVQIAEAGGFEPA